MRSLRTSDVGTIDGWGVLSKRIIRIEAGTDGVFAVRQGLGRPRNWCS